MMFSQFPVAENARWKRAENWMDIKELKVSRKLSGFLTTSLSSLLPSREEAFSMAWVETLIEIKYNGNIFMHHH
jgi:hypothetical protein